MVYTIEMTLCDMIYLPSFIKIATGVQTILKICLRYLRRCNVGTTDGKDFLIMPLKWAQVP
jgi:hypothetical protein